MAAAATLLTNVAELDPEITFEAEYVHQNKALGESLVRVVDISGIPGSTAEFPIFTEVAGSASPAEGTAPTSHQMDLTMPTLTVAKRAVNVHLTDLAAISASGNLAAQIGHAMGKAKAKQDDVQIFGALTATTDWTTQAGATNAALSLTNLQSGLNLLELNEIDDELFGVVHPFQYKSIRSALTPVANDDGVAVSQASEMTGKGMVSQIYGAQWFVTNRVGSGTNGSTGDVYSGLLFSKAAIGYAKKSKVQGIELDRRGETAHTVMIWNYFDKVGVLRADAVCKLASTSA